LLNRDNSLKFIDQSLPSMRRVSGKFSFKTIMGEESEIIRDIKIQICKKIANCFKDNFCSIK
jgi:hypothetical protein